MVFQKETSTIVFAILLLSVLSIESNALGIPKVDSLKNKLKNPLDTVKNITNKLPDPVEKFDKITDKIPDPLDAFDKIAEKIPDPIAGVKNFTELVATTAVYVKNNVSLNCFGLPIAAFANVVEKIFTQSTKAQDVRFYFATQTKPEFTTALVDNFTIQDTNFDVRRPTVVISHGFMASGRDRWMKEMKDAFLQLVNF